MQTSIPDCHHSRRTQEMESLKLVLGIVAPVLTIVVAIFTLTDRMSGKDTSKRGDKLADTAIADSTRVVAGEPPPRNRPRPPEPRHTPFVNPNSTARSSSIEAKFITVSKHEELRMIEEYQLLMRRREQIIDKLSGKGVVSVTKHSHSHGKGVLCTAGKIEEELLFGQLASVNRELRRLHTNIKRVKNGGNSLRLASATIQRTQNDKYNIW